MANSMTATTSPAAPIGLDALEARLGQEFEWLCLPAASWVPKKQHDGTDVTDVLVVGGGMCGLTAAASLKLLGIDNIRIVDKSPEQREGPWVTFARMETLRSPKTLTGPSLGFAPLTFRAWYEAQFGLAAWNALDKIPRAQWMDYLIWYKKVMNLEIENHVTVSEIVPVTDDVLNVTLNSPAGVEHVFVRHLVLATGRDGGGKPQVPAFAHTIDRRYWAHSADDIDFAALQGKRVAVIGAGASAMDNAATALEAGAKSLDMFIRRRDIPRVNKLTGVSNPGLTHGFAYLPDEWRWRFNHYAMVSQTPPPRSSTLRVSRHENARFHLGSPVESLREADNALMVQTPHGEYAIDFLIFGTGFTTDLDSRAELASVMHNVKLWKDVYAPADEESNRELSNSPYLGAAFECLEKRAGTCPAVEKVHIFNYAALASQGKLSGDIPAISVGAQRLAQGIASSLLMEDRETHFATLQAYETPELFGDEWVDVEAMAQPAE